MQLLVLELEVVVGLHHAGAAARSRQCLAPQLQNPVVESFEDLKS
jgi:hypothetical protein